MSRGTFDPSIDGLPETLAIFPLTGVLLLPGSHLPLNIFEPRYLALFNDALAGDRLVGMIQPSRAQSEQESEAPEIYVTGCAGRITSFSETDDGRYLVTLTGLIRFDVEKELSPKCYRRVEPNYLRFHHDLTVSDPAIDRPRLMAALKIYFKTHNIDGDWAGIEEAPTEALINSLCMLCPFEPWEKQALLEAKSLSERARALTALFEISAYDRNSKAARH